MALVIVSYYQYKTKVIYVFIGGNTVNMKIELIEYMRDYEDETVKRIADFFGFQANLISGDKNLNDENYKQAKSTLNNWLNRDNRVYVISFMGNIVGFVHIGFRGDNVAWIEEIYVDNEYRGRGIATEAIHQAEIIIKNNPNYTAVCLDVSPRNINALKLYHKSGYDNISIITLRKEFYNNQRDVKISILGLEFNQ